jgi:hypothetical protein
LFGHITLQECNDNVRELVGTYDDEVRGFGTGTYELFEEELGSTMNEYTEEQAEVDPVDTLVPASSNEGERPFINLFPNLNDYEASQSLPADRKQRNAQLVIPRKLDLYPGSKATVIDGINMFIKIMNDGKFNAQVQLEMAMFVKAMLPETDVNQQFIDTISSNYKLKQVIDSLGPIEYRFDYCGGCYHAYVTTEEARYPQC